MSAYKIGFTTDHFYVLSNFVLGNSINCVSMLIHSQVIIFISSMSWYRLSIITDTKCHSKINYPIAFDRILSKIRQLEEDHVNVVSKIALNTNKLVEGEFKVLLKRSKILLMQEDYAVTFSFITKKIYGSGCLRSVVRRFVLFFTVIEGNRQLFLSRYTDCVLSYNAEPKKLRKFGKVLNNSIFIAKFLFESSNCVLRILVLLEILRTLEDYLATLKIYPFLKYGKSKRGRV